MALFVGRDRELTWLDEKLREAFAATGQLVLVSGEPGIGKTRIAEELTRRAQSEGFVAGWGRTWEGPGTPAYFPWLSAIRRVLPESSPVAAAARAQSPELAALLDGRGGPTAGDPSEGRFRMFDAFAELLRAASADTPILVVLDDLHAADISTLELLHFVARSPRSGARLLIVGTMRDVSEARDDGRQLLGRIAREAEALPLARLGREAVHAWIDSTAPDLRASVDRLLSISEGNPLFVSELLAAEKKRPGHRWTSAHELPLGIREAIRAHLATLSEPTRAALAHAAVLGREFSAAAIHALAGDVRAGIEEATSAGIVLPDEKDDRYRFTHVLIRDELYATLTPETRASLHRSVAAREPDPARAVSHWLAGARPEDAGVLFDVVATAMSDATARYAFDDAALIGERALDGGLLAPRQACELRIAVGETWRLAGKEEAARAAGLRAFGEARALGDGHLLARAALVHAVMATVGARDLASVELLRLALDAIDASDARMRAKLSGRLAQMLMPAPPEEHEAALRLAVDALGMARATGDDETMFSVLQSTRTWETADAETRYALNAETIALARTLGKVAQVSMLLPWQVAARIELGDFEGALREADAMEALLSGYSQPVYRQQILLVRALVADLEGRFADADALSNEARRIGEEHGIVPGLMLFVVQRTGFLYTRGDDESWAEVEPLAFRYLDNDPLFAIYRCTFDAPCGRAEYVRASLARTKGIPLHSLPDAAGLAAPCAVAGVVEHAAPLYDLLAREEANGHWQFGPGRVTSMGPRALTLGRLAALLGREDDAVAHLRRALALVERMRLRPFVAQAELELARLLVERTPAEARERAARAEAIAHDLGMRRVAERARGLLDSNELSGSASRATDAPPKIEVPTPTVKEAPALTLARRDETWVMARGAREVVLKDSKGLAYLEKLIGSPCREVHVLELVGLHDEGDGGPMLDGEAKRQYRERVEALGEEIEDATKNADLGRAGRARGELDAIARELARAVGLGGRDRRAVSPSERARINVQRRIRDVLARVRAADAILAEHLQVSVRTGMFCVYRPLDPR